MKYRVAHDGFQSQELTLHVSFWGKIRISQDGQTLRSGNRTCVARDDAGRSVPFRLTRRFLDPVPVLEFRNTIIEVVQPFRWFTYLWILLPVIFVTGYGIYNFSSELGFLSAMGLYELAAIAGSFLAGLLLRTGLPTPLKYVTSGVLSVFLLALVSGFLVLFLAAVRLQMYAESMERYVEFAQKEERKDVHGGGHAQGTLPKLLPPDTKYDLYGYPLIQVNRPFLRFLLRTGKYKELNDTLAYYQRLYESDFRAENLLAHAYEVFEIDTTTLMPYINDWVRKCPDQYQPLLARGTYLQGLGWTSRGYSWAKNTSDSSFRKMEWYFEQAENDLFRVLDLQPHAFLALEKLISISCGRGRRDVGEVLAGEGLKLCPYGARIRDRYMNELRPRWMGSHQAMESYARTADAYSSVNPKLKALHGQQYWDMASLASIDSNEQAAVELDAKALSFGEDWRFYEDRAKSYWVMNNFAAALNDFDKALAIYPGKPELVIMKAKMLFFLGRTSECSVLLDSAATLDPEFSHTVYLWKNYAAATLVKSAYSLYTGRRDEEAIEAYNRALAFFPSSALAYHFRGSALIHLNRFDEAAGDLRRAILYNPHYVESYTMLDWLLARERRWDEIIRMWDGLITLEPANGRAYFERGGANFQKGDLTAAKRDAKKACELGYQQACSMLQRLGGG